MAVKYISSFRWFRVVTHPVHRRNRGSVALSSADHLENSILETTGTEAINHLPHGKRDEQRTGGETLGEGGGGGSGEPLQFLTWIEVSITPADGGKD